MIYAHLSNLYMFVPVDFCMHKALRLPSEVTQVRQLITIICNRVNTALRHHKKIHVGLCTLKAMITITLVRISLQNAGS